jgi:hypothetical protein
MPNNLAASPMDFWFEMYHINNNNCFSGGIFSLPLTLLEVKKLIPPRHDRIAVYMLLYTHKHIKDHGPFICVAIFSILYPCKNEEQDEEQQ